MANYQYIVGVIASLLGFTFLFYNYSIRRLKKTRKACSMQLFDGQLAGAATATATATDVIIVGAGVAGAALAYALGKDGRRVHVIERDINERDIFSGEGILPGGYLKLTELGLADCLEKIDAQLLLGYAFYKSEKSAKLTFPRENFESSGAGKTFHHGRFVQRLREKAASLPNVNLDQGTVTSLIEENGTIKGVYYKKSGEELRVNAPLTIVCDGSFSNLRRSLCYPKVDNASHFVGFVLENCKIDLASYGDFIVADPSVIIFYRISSTEVRCLVDVPGQKIPSIANGEMDHFLRTIVAPQVPPKLRTAFNFAIEKPNNIRSLPNRIMPAAPHSVPGAFLIGDAFNMRHAITGGGMTVALSDVVLLRDLLKPLNNLTDASAVCKYLQSFYTLRKPTASVVNTLANTLHKVFSGTSIPAMVDMQQACIGYLNLGGVFSSGFAAQIGAQNPHPLKMLFHLLALAIYGSGRLLLPFPSPNRMWRGAKLIWAASVILLSLIKSEGVQQMFFPLTVPAYYTAPPTK